MCSVAQNRSPTSASWVGLCKVVTTDHDLEQVRWESLNCLQTLMIHAFLDLRKHKFNEGTMHHDMKIQKLKTDVFMHRT
jgi:hypothetical protein